MQFEIVLFDMKYILHVVEQKQHVAVGILLGIEAARFQKRQHPAAGKELPLPVFAVSRRGADTDQKHDRRPPENGSDRPRTRTGGRQRRRYQKYDGEMRPVSFEPRTKYLKTRCNRLFHYNSGIACKYSKKETDRERIGPEFSAERPITSRRSATGYSE